MTSDRQALQRLIELGHPCVAIGTFEEDYVLGLVREIAIELGRPALVWSVGAGVQDALLSSSKPVASTEKPADALAHFAELADAPLCIMLDLAAHLDDARTLRVLRNLLRHLKRSGAQLVLIDHQTELPAVVQEYASYHQVSLPDQAELEQIVRSTLRDEHARNRIEIDISRAELAVILRNLRGLTRRHAAQIIRDAVIEDRKLDADDINHILARKRQALHRGGLLQFIESPTNLSEIGGLRRLKSWLALREDAVGEHAEQFGLVPPRGVLLLGVQGAGKSMCAKAIATAWQRPLLRMDVGALYDRYIGESERRLRDALGQAEAMAPIVLWIDEIEKAFASAASRSSDGGLSQRMFGALLTWMQEHEPGVFLVATANDIEALPPELLRKGRFDEIFFVDLPTPETRQQIFGIHLRKRRRDPARFDLPALADASDGFSGAEIEQAVLAALHEAYGQKSDLTTEDIVAALRQSPPLSVTMAERVQRLRDWAATRCVPAD